VPRGHAYTGDIVLEAKDGEGEHMLWALLRCALGYDEDAALVRRIVGAEPLAAAPVESQDES
jgi:hypothetical protein